MSVKLTDTNAIVTFGRGKNKTVALDVSFDDLHAWAKRSAVDEKRLWKRSFNSAIKGLKGKFASVMTKAGAVPGFPRFKNFEAFTNELRAKTNRTSPMGGVLADRRRIVAFPRNGWWIIGWPDSLAEWSRKFQEGEGGRFAEAFLTDSQSRARLHRRGIRDIPRVYTHNPRPVFPEPFGGFARANLDNWAQRIFLKNLASLMAKNAKGAP